MHSIKSIDNSLLQMLFNIKNKNEPRTTSSSSSNSSCRIPEPDFSSFDCSTKTDPAMSEDEYKKAIVEQAKEDAANGICSGESSGYQKLMKSFISVVSPDRRGIIAKSFKSLRIPEKSNYLEIKDSNNDVIAHYSKHNGWTMIGTNAEAARCREFCAIYMSAWGDAYDAYFGKDNSGNSTPIISGSTFDVSG